jgi:hypothetical protein
MFLGLLDPDPLVRGTDPDPSRIRNTGQTYTNKQSLSCCRPSILRKRDCEGTPVKGGGGHLVQAPPGSPPTRPDSSSGSSTVSAPSSAAFSGDEQVSIFKEE